MQRSPSTNLTMVSNRKLSWQEFFTRPETPGYQLTLFGQRGARYVLHNTSDPPSFWTTRRLCHPNQLVKIIAAVIAVIIAILIIVVIAVFGPPTLGKLLIE